MSVFTKAKKWLTWKRVTPRLGKATNRAIRKITREAVAEIIDYAVELFKRADLTGINGTGAHDWVVAELEHALDGAIAIGERYGRELIAALVAVAYQRWLHND